MILYSDKCPENWSSTINGACCFIEHQGRWLLLQNNDQCDDEHHGLWGIPGGKMGTGEVPADAAARAIFEETGLTIAPEALEFWQRVYITPPVPLKAYSLYIFHTHLTVTPQAIVIDPLEHQAFAWLTSDQALTLPLIPGGDAFIRDFVAFSRDRKK